MAKAIVVPSGTSMIGNNATIGYSATVIGPPNYSYGGDYVVNTGISVGSNLTAWRNKIIAQAGEQGVTLLLTDIIVFGAPA